jgi:hypothetical protein
MRTSMPHIAAIAMLVLMVGSLDACNSPQQAASTGSPAGQAGQATTLSDAEIKYGVSPTRNKDVTYQDDVIVMEHGAEAIRSLSSNGLTYTLDANAPGAKDIQPDKILFATGRVVGRVLEVKRNGNDVAVTLGPIELTEVFKEAHISYHGTLDFSKMIVYQAPPDYPGTFIDQDAEASPNAMRGSANMPIQIAQLSSSLPSGWRSGSCGAVFDDSLQQSPYSGCGGGGGAAGQVIELVRNGLHFIPDLSQGLGVTSTGFKNGVKYTAYAGLQLNNPDFTFNLDIHGGRLNTAEVEVAINGKFKVSFDGGTGGDFTNPNQITEIPVDLSIPLPVAAPFAVTLHNSILIQTLITAKQATLKAEGIYSLSGMVKAGIVNGAPVGKADLSVTVDKGLTESVDGISLGVNGVVLGYGGRILAGIGAFSLAVGPYVGLKATVGATRGSDQQGLFMAGVTCRSAEFNMDMGYGVGVAVPNFVVKILNGILSVFSSKAQISSSYSHELGTVKIMSNSRAIPPSCGPKAQ